MHKRVFLKVYIVSLSLATAFLATAGAWCVRAAALLTTDSSSGDQGRFACQINLHGCSNCGEGWDRRSLNKPVSFTGDWSDELSTVGCSHVTPGSFLSSGSSSANGDHCPEWSRKEIMKYARVYLIVVGLCGVFSCMYTICGEHEPMRRL